MGAKDLAEKNLLQLKVAMDLNTTQTMISNYETGRVFPSPDMLVRLADYYNTSIDYASVTVNQYEKGPTNVTLLNGNKVLKDGKSSGEGVETIYFYYKAQ